jgi:hypothetical protein
MNLNFHLTRFLLVDEPLTLHNSHHCPHKNKLDNNNWMIWCNVSWAANLFWPNKLVAIPAEDSHK